MASQASTSAGSQNVPENLDLAELDDGVNIYYICQRKWDAQGLDRCNAASKSEGWSPKSDDPNAPAQRWYCPVCGARYRAAYGVLVEILLKGDTEKAIYCKADLPPGNMYHLMTLCAQGRVTHVDDMLPEPADAIQESLRMQGRSHAFLPQNRDDFFTEIVPGVFTFSGGVRGLPTVHWYQIYYIINKDRLNLPSGSSGSPASAPFP